MMLDGMDLHFIDFVIRRTKGEVCSNEEDGIKLAGSAYGPFVSCNDKLKHHSSTFQGDGSS